MTFLGQRGHHLFHACRIQELPKFIRSNRAGITHGCHSFRDSRTVEWEEGREQGKKSPHIAETQEDERRPAMQKRIACNITVDLNGGTTQLKSVGDHLQDENKVQYGGAGTELEISCRRGHPEL